MNLLEFRQTDRKSRERIMAAIGHQLNATAAAMGFLPPPHYMTWSITLRPLVASPPKAPANTAAPSPTSAKPRACRVISTSTHSAYVSATALSAMASRFRWRAWSPAPSNTAAAPPRSPFAPATAAAR
jgi:hypothetical protein